MRKVFAVLILLSLITVPMIIFDGGGVNDGPILGEPTRGSAYINETTSSIAKRNLAAVGEE